MKNYSKITVIALGLVLTGVLLNTGILTKFSQASEKPKFGFNVFGWYKLNSSQKQTALRSLNELKVDMVRLPFSWAFSEPQKNNLNLGPEENMIDDLVGNGTNCLLFVGTSPRWAVKNFVKCEANPPDDPNEFARFLRLAAGKLKTKGLAWEIWNEPDNPPYWGKKKSKPQEYIDLLRPAYKAIKEADPTATVVGGSVLIQFMNKPDYSYLEGLLEGGVLNYCDVISVHIYPEENEQAIEQLDNALDTVIRLVRKYGNKEIWLTEVGIFAKQFSQEKLKELLKAKGLGPFKINVLMGKPMGKLAFMPVKVPAVLAMKTKNKQAIQRALEPYGLTFDDAMRISQDSWIDTQKEQSELIEAAYLRSPECRMFWFELYDFWFPMGVLNEQFEPRLAYERLLQSINERNQ